MTTLTSSRILDSIHADTLAALGVNTTRVTHPLYLDTPAVAFTFAAQYITGKGTLSKGRRTYTATIWEDHQAAGQFYLLVNRHAASGRAPYNEINAPALSADQLNSTLLSLLP